MHPSLEGILRGFAFEHLSGDARDASRACHALSKYMAKHIESSPELVAGLRKLLEAKDCFVRAIIYAEQDRAKADESSNAGEEDRG